MTALLDVKDLAKAYHGLPAVQGVSFALAAGEVLALIGPNGAGKSTTFNMLSGQIAPDGGRIALAGRDVTGKRPARIWRLGVGRTFQITATLASMTVRENVQLALLSHDRGLHRLWGRADAFRRGEADAVLALVGLVDGDRACNALPYGDLKRLELAIALSTAPRLLLMDEPAAGMAPAERIALMALTARIARERQIGVLFTEHDMDVVFAHADRIMVLERGRLIANGTPEEVRADRQVRAAYLG
jgi:branched-chain amino acid transport system ATP-binding protein